MLLPQSFLEGKIAHDSLHRPKTREIVSPEPRLQRFSAFQNQWAAAKLRRVLDPHAVLEHAALHAVLASLRDVETPIALFARHAEAYSEFTLIASLVPWERQAAFAYEILDTAFLMRWNELTNGGDGPVELPPLRARYRRPGPSRLETP